MRVLLLSFHYPPDPAVGSVRAARVAEAFAEAGHEVDVVTARIPRAETQSTASRPSVPGVRVHQVLRLPNARELALAGRRIVRRRRRPADGENKQSGWVVPAHIPPWKRFLVAMALLPDGEQGFILPAVLRAMRLMRRGADLLYTSGPPHSAHVAGLMLRRLTRVRWAAEFRDPWTDNAVQPRYAVSETASRIKAWLERQTLAAADHLITVSDAAGDLFASKTGHAQQGRILVVRNGIAATEPPRPTAPHADVRVLYLGNLYHARDPRPFLDALAVLRAAGDPAALRTRVDFFGECRIFRGESVEGFVSERGLQDVVHLHRPVSRIAVAALMADADLLLLFAQQQPLQVPAKLYEYLGARRPILAFADAHGETAAMLRRVKGHFLVTDTDPAQVRDTVQRALAIAPAEHLAGDEAVLDEWSADRQMALLLGRLTAPMGNA